MSRSRLAAWRAQIVRTPDQWKLRVGQLAVDHMEIRPANAARGDPDEDLAVTGLGIRQLALGEGGAGLFEDDRAHRRTT